MEVGEWIMREVEATVLWEVLVWCSEAVILIACVAFGGVTDCVRHNNQKWLLY